MKRASWEHLMQEVLDGVAGLEDRRRLEARLAVDPAARLRYREQEATFRALEALEAVDAPPDLAADAVRLAGAREKPDTAGAARNRVSGSPSGRALRYAFAFAAGAALTALVVAVLPGGRPLRSGEEFPGSGSLTAPQAVRPGKLLDRRELTLSGTTVFAETRHAGGRTLLWITARASEEIAITLHFDPGALHPMGLEWADGVDPALRMDPGRITVRHGGKGSLRLAFMHIAPQGALIHIEVQLRGESIGDDLKADRSTGQFDDPRARGTGLASNLSG